MSDHPEPATVLVQWDVRDYRQHYANMDRSATITSLLFAVWLGGAAAFSAFKFEEYPLAIALALAAIWKFAKPDVSRWWQLRRLPDYYYAPYTYYLDEDGVHYDTAHERRMIRWAVINSVQLGPGFWHISGKTSGLHIPHRYMTPEQMVVMRDGFRKYHQRMAPFFGRDEARLQLGD